MEIQNSVHGLQYPGQGGQLLVYSIRDCQAEETVHHQHPHPAVVGAGCQDSSGSNPHSHLLNIELTDTGNHLFI